MPTHTKSCSWSAPASDDGFTMLEVIVALTILSISLAVLFGIFSQSIARNGASEILASQRALAQSLLADVRDKASLPPGSHGLTSDGLSWQVRVAPFGSDDDQKNWPSQLVRVTVTVTAPSGANPYTITSLRLLPKDTQQ